MDSEETALYGMEEVETCTNTTQATDRHGIGPGESPDQCLQWPWTMVELGLVAHERGVADFLLSKTGFDLTH